MFVLGHWVHDITVIACAIELIIAVIPVLNESMYTVFYLAKMNSDTLILYIKYVWNQFNVYKNLL